MYPKLKLTLCWTKFCSDAETQVAIPEGRFTSVAEKASIVLDEFVGTDKEAITLEQILRMRAGLAAHRGVAQTRHRQ